MKNISVRNKKRRYDSGTSKTASYQLNSIQQNDEAIKS
jgi:hypothetical protein